MDVLKNGQIKFPRWHWLLLIYNTRIGIIKRRINEKWSLRHPTDIWVEKGKNMAGIDSTVLFRILQRSSNKRESSIMDELRIVPGDTRSRFEGGNKGYKGHVIWIQNDTWRHQEVQAKKTNIYSYSNLPNCVDCQWCRGYALCVGYFGRLHRAGLLFGYLL